MNGPNRLPFSTTPQQISPPQSNKTGWNTAYLWPALALFFCLVCVIGFFGYKELALQNTQEIEQSLVFDLNNYCTQNKLQCHCNQVSLVDKGGGNYHGILTFDDGTTRGITYETDGRNANWRLDFPLFNPLPTPEPMPTFAPLPTIPPVLTPLPEPTIAVPDIPTPSF